MTCLAVCAAIRPNTAFSIFLLDHIAQFQRRVALLGNALFDFIVWRFEFVVFDHGPVAERIVVARAAIDMHAHVRFFMLETLTRRACQCGFDRLEDNIAGGRLFSLEIASTTIKISLLMRLPRQKTCPFVHHPGACRKPRPVLFVELRDNVRRIDAFDRKAVLFAFQLQ